MGADEVYLRYCVSVEVLFFCDLEQNLAEPAWGDLGKSKFGEESNRKWLDFFRFLIEEKLSLQ